MASRLDRILILCKTYPSPSSKHAETSCVAGIEQTGAFIRLYPVPFRLIADEHQFKKWQWIEARIEKAPADHRPESHKLYVDTIVCDPEPLPSAKDDWRQRRSWLDRIRVFEDFAEIEANRQTIGGTLALLRPKRILSLDIQPTASPDWTEEEKEKLLQMQRQGELFDAVVETKDLRLLKKIPFDFYYSYECKSGTYRHKLVDWEVGALFWKVRRRHGADWERPFRDKLESDLPTKDLLLMLGTIHRFPDQWLIASLLYPPKQTSAKPHQGLLWSTLNE